MRSQGIRKAVSSQKDRNFLSFLLVQQFEAEAIGRRIAQARKEAGLRNQQELAELLGVTLRSVQGYEAGAVIPYAHFRRIEEITGKPLEWFLRGDPEPTTERDAELVERLDRLDEGLAEMRELLRSLVADPQLPPQDRPAEEPAA